MRRYVSTSIISLLLFSFFLTTIGGFIAFELAKKQIKKSIKLQLKASVPKNELVTFTFASKQYNNLNWIKKDKEFKLGNNMFDVVNRFEENGIISLICINDKQEANLFKQLDYLVELNMGFEKNLPAQKKGSKIIGFAEKLFFEKIGLLNITLPSINKPYFNSLIKKMSGAFLNPLFSPPKN